MAVAAFRATPPKLIRFDPFDIDGIPFTLRYYVISQYLFRRYQPDTRVGYVVPSERDWEGFDECPRGFGFPIAMGHLPSQWGERRSPDLTVLREHTVSSNVWTSTQDQGMTFWTCPLNCVPRQYNYLEALLVCESTSTDPEASLASLRFASPNGSFDAINEVTFLLIPDGQIHRYLIPIGTSPGWSWRKGVNQIRIDPQENVSIKPVQFSLKFIDELGDALDVD